MQLKSPGKANANKQDYCTNKSLLAAQAKTKLVGKNEIGSFEGDSRKRCKRQYDFKSATIC